MRHLLLFLVTFSICIIKTDAYEIKRLIDEPYSAFSSGGSFVMNDSLFFMLYNGKVGNLYHYSEEEGLTLYSDSPNIDMRRSYINGRAYNIDNPVFDRSYQVNGIVNYVSGDTIVYSEKGLSFDGGETYFITSTANQRYLYYYNDILIVVTENGILYAKYLGNLNNIIISYEGAEIYTYADSYGENIYILHGYSDEKAQLSILNTITRQIEKIIEMPFSMYLTEVDLEIISEDNILISDGRTVYRYNGEELSTVRRAKSEINDIFGTTWYKPRGYLITEYNDYYYLVDKYDGIIKTKDFVDFESVWKSNSGRSNYPTAAAIYNGKIYGTYNIDFAQREPVLFEFDSKLNTHFLIDDKSNFMPQNDEFSINKILHVDENHIHLVAQSNLLSVHAFYMVIDRETMQTVSSEYITISDMYTNIENFIDIEGSVLLKPSLFGTVDLKVNGIDNPVSIEGNAGGTLRFYKNAFLNSKSVFIISEQNGIYATNGGPFNVVNVEDVYDLDNNLLDVKLYNAFDFESDVYSFNNQRLYRFDKPSFSFREVDIYLPQNTYYADSELIQIEAGFIVINHPDGYDMYSIDNGNTWNDWNDSEYGEIKFAEKSEGKYIFGTTEGTFYFEDPTSVNLESTSTDKITLNITQSITDFTTANNITDYTAYSANGKKVADNYNGNGIVIAIDNNSNNIYYLRVSR